MSLDIDVAVFAGGDPILTIAEDLFGSMIDGEPGHLLPLQGEAPSLRDAVHAWVDVHGPVSGRVLLTTEHVAADLLTRALLGMAEDEAVTPADQVDAFGELANVVGGNVKALIPEAGVLTLPQVGPVRPETDPARLLHELALLWRGFPLLITLWRLP